MQQQGPFSPHPSMMPPYLDPTKHLSMHSSVVGVGPALPGYMPHHDPGLSPQPMFPDFLNPTHQPAPSSNGGDVATTPQSHSASPNQMYSVPAYTSGMGAPQSM
jgi:hypothetical protein